MGTLRERHIAIVTDNDDPEKRFRIKAASASLLGTDDNGDPLEFGDWIEPQFAFLDNEKEDEQGTCGFFSVPGVGTTVEISVAVTSSHDMAPAQTFITNPDPRWVSCLFVEGDTTPEEFKSSYPHRMGFKDTAGNLFYFSKEEDNERILIKHSKGSFASFEKNGDVTITTNQSDDTSKKGMLFFLDHENQGITILHPAGHFLNFHEGGITLVKGGPGGQTFFTITDGGVNVLTPSNITMQGGVLNLQGGQILLGGQTAVLSLLTEALIGELTNEFGNIATAIGSVGGTYLPTPTFGNSSKTLKVKGE